MGLFDKFVGPKEDEEDDLDEVETADKKDSVSSAPTVPVRAKKQFVLVKPEDSSNEGLLAIADHLLNHETVILNLELIAKDSRHFVDFLSGVSYAMQGQTKKVAANTYLITPGGIEVSGDISGSLEPDLKF